MSYRRGLEVLGGTSQYEIDKKHYQQQVHRFNAAMAEYYRKNPKATNADVERFRASWRLVEPVPPAVVAAQGCNADGMDFWNWLALALLVLVALYVSRVIAEARSRSGTNTTPAL